MSKEKKTGRGGARIGAGRKPNREKLVTVTLTLPLASAEWLRVICAATGVPRWRILSKLIEQAPPPEFFGRE